MGYTNMTIQYYEKNVYGLPKNYIIDEGKAYLFKQLTGRITVDKSDMEILSKLAGVEFEQVLPPKK